MVKNAHYLLLVFVALLATSCSKSKDPLTCVPEDAAMVLKLYPEDLVKQADIKIDGGKMSIAGLDLPEDDDMDRLAKLADCGIDWEQGLVVASPGEDVNKVLFIASVKDEKTFDEYLLTPDKHGNKPEKSEENGITYYKDVTYNVAVKDGLMIAAELGKNEMSKFFDLDKNITDNDKAMERLSQKGQLVCYVDYGKVATSAMKLLGAAMPLQYAVFANLVSEAAKDGGFTMTADKSKLNYSSQCALNEESQFIKMLKPTMTKIEDTQFLNYLPANAMYYMAVSVNGQELADSDLSTMMLTTFGLTGLKECFSNINGPVAVAWAGDDAFYAAVKCKDPKPVYAMIESLGSKDLGTVSIQGDYIVLASKQAQMGASQLADKFKGKTIAMYGDLSAQSMPYKFYLEAEDLTSNKAVLETTDGKNILQSLIQLIYKPSPIMKTLATESEADSIDNAFGAN